MSNEKRPLGRGLDSLLGERPKQQGKTTLEINISDLNPSQYQPRQKMHKQTLEELSESIKQQGILQPLIARRRASGGYEIVLGERRWRAAQMAGLETVPVLVRELNNEEAAKIGLIENLQREDLNAMDLSRGLMRLQKEFNLSQEELGIAVGKSRPTIANLLRLLKLLPEVQEMLELGKIEMGHARALLPIEGEVQIELAREISKKNLSVREAELLAAKNKNKSKTKKSTYQKNPDTKRLEEEISGALGAKVSISHNKKGKGRIMISFNNLESLEGILSKIKR